MFNMFIKKQWNLAIFIVLSYFLILLFYDNLNNRFSERYINEQGNYIIKTKEDRKVFFNTLDLDLEKSREIVSAIENYENYDSEIIYDEIDPALITAGVNSYATYDMIIWKEEMLNMPGKWGETISDDYFMLIQLSERFRNQRNFELNLSNNIELMDRGMR